MSGRTPIDQDELKRTNTAFFALTTVFVVGRVIVHVTKRRNFELPDFFIYFAYALYVSEWSLYYAVTAPLYRVYAVVYGESTPYATMSKDAATMLTFISAAQMCFYTLLYSVKLSLLTLYWKLLDGLPKIYKKIWWGIVAFSCLAWVGSVKSSIFTCDDLKAKYKQGKCTGTADEQRRVIFSLYFVYALDVVTDIAVMALPIRLTWNLQMEKKQKIGIFALFGSGVICILFATIRLVQLGVDNGRATMPEPKWLLLWTVLETSVAVIIGCCPAFAVYLRKRINTKRSYGYAQASSDNIKLSTKITSSARPNDTTWEESHSSQEELAKTDGGILVTTTVNQDNYVGSARI